MQALGRGYVAIGPIIRRTKEALNEVAAAQAAVSQSDFETGSENFANAKEQLMEAREQLRDALSASRLVLETLDVTGTVRSGDNMLAAAESVTEAGQRVTEALSVLMASSGSVIGSNQKSERTLVGALEITQENMGVAQAALEDAVENLNGVNTLLLPASVKEPAQMLKEVVPELLASIQSFNEQSDLLLSVLGAQEDRRYLLVFQNNHELRPTGGFIGSLGVVNVSRGQVEEVDVQTVYDPDGQLKEYIAPPDPMRGITDRWYLRDANWFVDFDLSAEKIQSFWEKEGGSKVDGVIAITPEIIQDLLAITGPIEMPTYNVTVDEDNFIALTQDEVTYDYDKEVNRPKQFLADLTPVLLNRVFAQDSKAVLDVLNVMNNAIQKKSLLVNLTRTEEQARVHELNWSGELPEEQLGLLYVNNTNIGGHKSDQFMDQEIDYRSDVQSNGDVEVTVTIRRTHRGPEEILDREYPDGENPAYKDNVVWQRVLVPDEAELIEARGFTEAADVPRYDFPELPEELTADPDLAEWQRAQVADVSGTVIGQESGYKFFANWMITKPGATTVGIYRYRLPGAADLPDLLDPAERYETYVVKQPGDNRTEVRVEIRLPENIGIVHTIPHDGITTTSSQELVYRGELNQDVLVGAVLERQ